MTAPTADQPRSASQGVPALPPRAALRYDLVRRIVEELKPRTVAELGCGLGAVGARLAEIADYVGVEPDEQSFATAAERITTRGGRVINGIHKDLPTGVTFDLVCAFEVLEHIEDDAGTLAEWVPLVGPGGHLMLSVPAFQDRFGASDTFAGHFRRYEPEALTELLTSAGLEDVSVHLYGWPLGYALEAVRNRIDTRKLARTGHASPEHLTAASGRTFQPRHALIGAGITLTTAPFRYLQRLRPDSGTGLVALGRRPA